MNRVVSYLIVAALFFGGGFYFGDFLNNADSDPEDRREVRVGLYKYINPLLDCEVMDEKGRAYLAPLKKEINSIISQNKQSGVIVDAAVYFRDLNNGPWLGINEKSEFVAASLLKVPMMLLMLKMNEFEPGIMDMRITYQGQYDNKDNLHQPVKSLVASSTYTVRQMVEKMVVHSDNKSWKVLQDEVKQRAESESLVNAMAELGVIMPTDQAKSFAISAKGYSAMFRVLFNSSFLSRSNSEYALKLLAQGDFDEGLSQGLPEDVVLANKFGYNDPQDGEYQQLHDCGIVYYPEHPYLLCVMSKKSKNNSKSAPFIAEVSRAVYRYWDGLER